MIHEVLSQPFERFSKCPCSQQCEIQPISSWLYDSGHLYLSSMFENVDSTWDMNRVMHDAATR